MSVASAARPVTARVPAGVALVIAGVALFCTVYIVLVFYRLHSLLLGVDTGTYLQTVVNFIHSGSTNNLGEHRPKLSVHDSWTVILALAPIVALWPSAQALLIAGVVVVAIAAVPLYFFSRAMGASDAAAAIVAGAYLLSPAAQGWVFGNFTESHFVPLLAFSLAWAARQRSLLWTAVLAQLLTGVKEDESLFLLMFGLASIIWYDRKLGIAVSLIAVVNFAVYGVLVHASGYAPHNPPYRLTDTHWLSHLGFLAEQLAPFAFAPLFLGRRILFGVPFYAEVTFNAPWMYEMAHGGSHYTIPLVSIIAIGTAIAVAEQPKLPRFILPCAVLCALFLNTTVLRIGRHEVPPQWAGYCAAVRASRDELAHTYGVDEQGQFAIAAANPKAAFVDTGAPARIDRPPWWTATPPAAPPPPPPDIDCGPR